MLNRLDTESGILTWKLRAVDKFDPQSLTQNYLFIVSNIVYIRVTTKKDSERVTNEMFKKFKQKLFSFIIIGLKNNQKSLSIIATFEFFLIRFKLNAIF
jgi:hypothetical protein